MMYQWAFCNLQIESNDHLKHLKIFYSCHINMSFSRDTGKENKLSFLGVEIVLEQDKYTITVYLKATFSGV